MSRSVRLCFVCILSMFFAGASGMAWARSITSISVDKATSTATISCEAGEVGDGHVVYFAWSTDRVDYGDDIGDWPNFVRVCWEVSDVSLSDADIAEIEARLAQVFGGTAK